MASTNEKNWVSEEEGERKTIEFASTTWILGSIESSKWETSQEGACFLHKPIEEEPAKNQDFLYIMKTGGSLRGFEIARTSGSFVFEDFQIPITSSFLGFF